ncbi:MAG: alkaline phosphatase family protein [Flavitalea sp.]
MNKFLTAFFLALPFLTQAQQKETRTILFFFDGLRPDYITEKGMPHLYAFSTTAAYGRKHHSVFPTVTRVNAASYATGSYPGRHGLMGNAVYFPQADPAKALNTGNASNLQKIDSVMNGHLLTAISLGEMLQAEGKQMMVFSSGSTGQAYLQNHKICGSIINPDLILPVSIKDEVYRAIGSPPADFTPNSARHKWITDALIRFGLADDGPVLSAIWLSDPDGAAHEYGIGSPQAIASLNAVDEQFGRVIQTIKEKGLNGNINIIVSADHGFITCNDQENLQELLIQRGLKKDELSDDVILADGALYVKDHDQQRILEIISLLQQQTWVGALFTKGKTPSDTKGWAPGTIAFSAIHWDHQQRAADILVDVNWNDEKNIFGYPGTSFAGGVAGHGGASPYEVHIPLLASGPDFKGSLLSDLPTSNVDIVPTVLYIHHIAAAPEMDGRIMYELLTNQPSRKILKVQKEIIQVSSGSYALQLYRSVLGKYQYVDFAKVKRGK